MGSETPGQQHRSPLKPPLHSNSKKLLVQIQQWVCWICYPHQYWWSWVLLRRPGNSALLGGWCLTPGLWPSVAPHLRPAHPAPSWPWSPMWSCLLCNYPASCQTMKEEQEHYSCGMHREGEPVKTRNSLLTLAEWAPGDLGWNQRWLQYAEVRWQTWLLLDRGGEKKSFWYFRRYLKYTYQS